VFRLALQSEFLELVARIDVRDPSMNIASCVEGSIHRFAREVKERLIGLAGSSASQVNRA
jgi:hypothetical protein